MDDHLIGENGHLVVPFEKVAEAPTAREVVRAARFALEEAREVDQVLADRMHPIDTTVTVTVTRTYAPGRPS